MGSTIYGDDYRIFLSNKKKKKFASIQFSFANKSTSIKEFKLPKNEVFIQSLSHLDTFFMLVADKRIGNLYLYDFDVDGNPKKHQIQFVNGSLLFSAANKPLRIAQVLIKNEVIKKFEKDTPNAIETASEKVKMFIDGNQVKITYDKNNKYTQVLTLDLTSKKMTRKNFNKPMTFIKSSNKKTNSFIYEDKIVIVAATRKVLQMEVLDFNTGTVLKKYAVHKDQDIQFKNTPIVQKGGAFKQYRELETTKKFLRKITTDKIGVSVIKNKGDYQFTIGGSIPKRSAMPMMGFGGLPIASFGNVTVFFNPTMLAYSSFANTKSIQIECLFDANFNHISDKKVPKNVFDKIKRSHTRNKAASTVFKYKGSYFKGDYNSWDKKYYIKKYTN